MIKLKNNILYYIKTNDISYYNSVLKIFEKSYKTIYFKRDANDDIHFFLNKKETICIYFEYDSNIIKITYDEMFSAFNINNKIIPEINYKYDYKNIINLNNYLIKYKLYNIKKYEN